MAEILLRRTADQRRVLSREEELELARALRPREDDTPEQRRARKRARDRFTEHNIGLVMAEARKFARRASSDLLDEFVSEGLVGLLVAVDKFDAERGWRFSTMACFWIRHYIRAAAVELAGSIQVPRRNDGDLVRAEAALEHELGRPPTDDELAARAEVTTVAVENRRAAGALRHPTSIDAPAGIGEDGERSSIGELIEDTTNTSMGEMVAEKEMHDGVRRALAELTPRERLVVMLRYGIDVERELTLREIAPTLENQQPPVTGLHGRPIKGATKKQGVTFQAVQQVHNRALSKLRQPSKRLREFLGL